MKRVGALTTRLLLSNSHFLSARVVPICPELRDLLTEAFERAEPGATSIAPMASRLGVNLRTYLERITPRASASGSTEPHKTTEPAATIQVAAASSKRAPVTETGRMAGTGTEQTRFHSGKQGVASSCDAECDAFSADRIELFARAVVLVAGMSIPDATRGAVLAAVAAKILGGA